MHGHRNLMPKKKCFSCFSSEPPGIFRFFPIFQLIYLIQCYIKYWEPKCTVLLWCLSRCAGKLVKITRNPDRCLKTKPSVEPTTCLRESRNVRHFIDLVLRDVKWSNCFKKTPFPDVHNCARQDCHGSDIYKRRQSLVLPRSFNRVVYFRAVWNTSSLGSRNNWRGQHAGDPFTVILFLPELRPQGCDCRPQQ
jgi:hypothetical protein